ncbi:MAG: peptidylprolyl isomerase [Clostridiales bacterium]|nr:peptidylprolyl isomerase [Clostridiales bacterium]
MLLKKLKWSILSIGLVFSMIGCSNVSTSEEGTELDVKVEEELEPEETDLLSGLHQVEIVVKDFGSIIVELDADVAPITVTNFMKLVEEGFYDGLTFHRVISGFMIQGGDPDGNGTGGSGTSITGEFSMNTIKNDISHTRGVISMARSANMNSASSQFFIMHQDATQLDGQYAAFGHVTEGMEIVDQICELTKVQDYNGTVDPVDQPIIEKITIIE